MMKFTKSFARTKDVREGVDTAKAVNIALDYCASEGELERLKERSEAIGGMMARLLEALNQRGVLRDAEVADIIGAGFEAMED